MIGLLAFLLLVRTAALVGRRASVTAPEDFDRQVARALFASVAAGALGLAFFDTLGFPQSAGILFLLMGLSGASLRLARAAGEPITATSKGEPRFSPSS